MSTKKKTPRYFWLKHFDEDVSGDIPDYIFSFENGPTIYSIYIILMHLVKNRKGVFKTQIHNVEIIDSPEKIKRDLKYFKFGDVTFTIGLLINLGIMAQMDDGAYYFTDYEDRFGSETKDAKRMRKTRKTKEKGLENAPKIAPNNVQKIETNGEQNTEQCSNNVRQEIRVKSKELKSKDIKSLDTRDRRQTDNSLPPPPSSSEELLTLFKKTNPDLSAPDKLSAEHKLAIGALLDAGHSYQTIATVFEVVAENAFLNGTLESANWGGAPFEFVISLKNFEKIIGGQYVQSGKAKTIASPGNERKTAYDPVDDQVDEMLAKYITGGNDNDES